MPAKLAPPPRVSAAALETVDLKVANAFEECLEFEWSCEGVSELKESTVEMVIDRSDPSKEGPLRPAKNAMVKQVEMGRNMRGCVQNMPDSRTFLVSIVGTHSSGSSVRSPWVRASTLNPKDRDKDLANLDPMSMPRLGCKLCPCTGYVPQRWTLNSAGKLRCRRCGCQYTDHVLVEAPEILKAREERAMRKLKLKPGQRVTPLPVEALEWDDRECELWFHTEGAFHPRETVGMNQPPVPEAGRSRPGGREGITGKRGRVSIVCPTIESRQKFHQRLWASFEAQEWQDKELVIVETYFDEPSRFFEAKAMEDSRLIYIKFQRKKGNDMSIGLKRNLCAHLATGEFIANFDDDDLYAPSYLSTMVPQLADRTHHAVTLSSWFIYDVKKARFSFCDAIAWGWQKGLDGDHRDVKAWAYGYGFSYVHRRQAIMEVPYEDINMGEDYGFVAKVLAKNGERSVQLFHDDFGICLHTQHGENTSNAFPIRDATLAEVLNLDIMDLPRAIMAEFLRPAGGEAPSGGRGCRLLLARMPDGDHEVECTAGATVGEFLKALAADGLSTRDCKVFRAPPETSPVDALRFDPGQGSDEWVAELLGFGLADDFKQETAEENDESAKLAEGSAAISAVPGSAAASLEEQTHAGVVADSLVPELSAVRRQKDRIIANARRPMRSQDRISLRIRHLWVVPLALLASTGDEEDELGDDEDCRTIEVSIQKASAKSYFACSSTVHIRLPADANVQNMRDVLGQDLPSTGRVLAEKEGRELMPLMNTDLIPDKVTVTEFKGMRSFYMIFSKKQCRGALTMMMNFFRPAECQARLDDMMRSAESDDLKYRRQLSILLMSEVYPPIFHRYGLPEGAGGAKCLMDGMGQVSRDLELAQMWLEVETLMRNKVNMTQAAAGIEELRRRQASDAVHH